MHRAGCRTREPGRIRCRDMLMAALLIKSGMVGMFFLSSLITLLLVWPTNQQPEPGVFAR
ncbi:MAG: hypothetical protein A2Y88_02410 [Chloroflexi bacterium RBG_13_48_10]|nr:MAG: hypothetical protein A2Y88_02410 [Chloroflexi bacterium RBG_13_48_10]